MRVLVDTSAYSAFFRGHEAIVEAIGRAEDLVLTPTVLGELLAGFRKGTRFDQNLERLQEFLGSPRARWVPLDDETADRYSIIHDGLRRAGAPVPANDLWIAASAMQHGLRLLTTDPHFRRIPQIAVTFHPAQAS
ncbi:MAG TPA: type II toxin-antitoxin system VapC family toxin [Thermoanaerobaculia bacterium]|nr:type II toxin-antitoxin system VapC family toxin [Thermoanaerobaculia bacterium]